MNRCSRHRSDPAQRRRLLVLASAFTLGFCLSAGASAQQMSARSFPAQAKRGMLAVTAPPEVKINGQTQRLSPGVRILGPTNMLVMSTALVGHTVAVNYLVDTGGMVNQVWILNAAEMEAQRGTWDTVTNFVFGSSGEQPKRDDGKTPFDQLPKYPKQ